MPHKKQGPNGWPSQPTPPGRLAPRADRPAPPPPAHARCCLPVPLPLPLLKWPKHPPSSLLGRSPPEMAASPPSAPIKGTPVTPHLTAPHTALFSSSLTPELAPTKHLHHRRFAAVARPLHCRPISGEGTPGTTVSPSPSSAPHGNRR
jgi:hypothetical protein